MLKLTRSCEAMLLSIATLVTRFDDMNTLSSTMKSRPMNAAATIDMTEPCIVASVRSEGILM